MKLTARLRGYMQMVSDDDFSAKEQMFIIIQNEVWTFTNR